MGYIYLRTNKINGKKYVGQTDNIKRRNREWKNLNARYGGYPINNARKKYGTDGFSFEILKECKDEELNQWEIYYIKMYNSKKPYGYNATDGGDSSYEITEETRKKMSEAHKGKHYPKLSAAMRGRKRPDISDAQRGRKRPDISDALRGRKHTEEARAKMSAAMRGKKRPAEVVEKIAAALRGKYNTKISKAVQALEPTTMEVFMEFPSTMEAERHGFSHGAVTACCLGKRKSHKGFIWRYAV